MSIETDVGTHLWQESHSSYRIIGLDAVRGSARFAIKIKYPFHRDRDSKRKCWNTRDCEIQRWMSSILWFSNSQCFILFEKTRSIFTYLTWWDLKKKFYTNILKKLHWYAKNYRNYMKKMSNICCMQSIKNLTSKIKSHTNKYIRIILRLLERWYLDYTYARNARKMIVTGWPTKSTVMHPCQSRVSRLLSMIYGQLTAAEFLFREMSSSLSSTLTPRSTCRKSRTSGGSEIRQESWVTTLERIVQ